MALRLAVLCMFPQRQNSVGFCKPLIVSSLPPLSQS